MGCEANTYEEMTLRNINTKTAELAEAIGNYLLKSSGIISLKMTIDGNEYTFEDDCISENDTELIDVCKNLSHRSMIDISFRVCNYECLDNRKENAFLSLVDSCAELKENFTYRSIDYYDTDTYVDMCLFDKNGIQTPEYNFGDERYLNSKWYCYTPDIYVTCESDTYSEDTHELISKAMHTFLLDICDGIDEEYAEEILDDSWDDCGEIYLNGSFSFDGSKIPEIQKLFQSIIDCTDVSLNFELNAVCEDEDRDFASISMINEDGEIKVGYCEY